MCEIIQTKPPYCSTFELMKSGSNIEQKWRLPNHLVLFRPLTLYSFAFMETRSSGANK